MGLRAAIVIVAASAVGAAALLAGADPTADREPASPAAHGHVRPAVLLARAPFMGVSCRRPNSIACNRVGLAVWLRRPALRVRAEIDGRRFELGDAESSSPPKLFAGYLRPAGLRDGELRVPVPRRSDRWRGHGEVSARVRLWVTEAARTRTTDVEVPLRAGWG